MSDKPDKPDDLMTLGYPSSQGVLPYVRRRSAESPPEFGLARLTKDPGNAPEGAEVLRLNHRGPGPVFEVETISGPAKVTTDEYRNGWDNIFGNKATVGQA